MLQERPMLQERVIFSWAGYMWTGQLTRPSQHMRSYTREYRRTIGDSEVLCSEDADFPVGRFPTKRLKSTHQGDSLKIVLGNGSMYLCQKEVTN